MDHYEPTSRTALHRRAQRARYDRDFVHSVLDESFVAHVGFVTDGTPVVLPMAYVRDGERLVLHGARANRMLSGLVAGGRTCATVTLLDGLVLAKSAFHHSMNYRCVVVFGTAYEIVEPREKSRVLDALVEKVAPGRSRLVRPSSESELAATLVVALPLEEVSGKFREGPPVDDPEDEALPVPAGVIPLALVASPRVPA